MGRGNGMRFCVDQLRPELRAQVMAKIGQAVSLADASRPNKFHAQPTVIDGERCDSKKEATQLLLYRDKQTMGEIRNLLHHGRVSIEVNGVHICDFEPDFLFEKEVDEVWRLHAADVKGLKRGPVYELFRAKARLFLAIHGTAVIEL